MLITTQEVLRLSELNLLTSETGKTLRKLTAERDELHRRLLEATTAGRKVEASCPFRLQVETVDKKYQPAYKQCAIALVGETAVTDWVLENDPHATEQKLALIPKALKQIAMSKPVRAMMDALKGAAARAA